MIKEVTTFIETKTGLTRDTDLFAGHRPQGIADDCDVVLESAGGSVFPELPERADIVFQVLSRAKTYLTARDRAWAIYDAIFRNHGYGSANWELPTVPSDSISACDVIDGDWTATAGGILSIDAGDKMEGTGSLKNTIAAPGAGTTYYANYTGTWNWSTKKHILLWLKSDRANTDFALAALVVYDGTNYIYWNLTFLAGEWTAIKSLLSTPDFETPTPPDLSTVSKVGVSFKAADETAFYKKIDDVRFADATLFMFTPRTVTHAGEEKYGSAMYDHATPGTENTLGTKVRFKLVLNGTSWTTDQEYTVVGTMYAKRN